MKVKISNLLVSFAAVFLFTFSVQAQEEAPLEPSDSNHRDVNLDEDKTLNADHPIHLNQVKDSVQSTQKIVPVLATKPPAVKPAISTNRKEDDDALSFNFLYYMLQKFKMSDLVDH